MLVFRIKLFCHSNCDTLNNITIIIILILTVIKIIIMMILSIIVMTGSRCLHKPDRGLGFCLDQLQLISHNAAFITPVITAIIVIIIIMVNIKIIILIMIINIISLLFYIDLELDMSIMSVTANFYQTICICDRMIIFV